MHKPKEEDFHNLSKHIHVNVYVLNAWPYELIRVVTICVSLSLNTQSER